MWLFLLGFGAIFAGYAIYIGPLGKKRDGSCGFRIDDRTVPYRLCQKQQDLYYGDGVSLLTNVFNEEELHEIENMFEVNSRTSISDSDTRQGNSFIIPLTQSTSSGLHFVHKIVQNFALQLWKEITMVRNSLLSSSLTIARILMRRDS
jgi:hypothetical protein